MLQIVLLRVTPCVGVWIETGDQANTRDDAGSHPAWVCGLKQSNRARGLSSLWVTPCVGVWIETVLSSTAFVPKNSHTLRGCVD